MEILCDRQRQLLAETFSAILASNLHHIRGSCDRRWPIREQRCSVIVFDGVVENNQTVAGGHMVQNTPHWNEKECARL